jgi:hypothetical protein
MLKLWQQVYYLYYTMIGCNVLTIRKTVQVKHGAAIK